MSKRKRSKSPPPTRSTEYHKPQSRMKSVKISKPDTSASSSSAVSSSQSILTFFKPKTSNQSENNDNRPDEISPPTTATTTTTTKHSTSKQSSPKWISFQRENLNLDYINLYNHKRATELLARCESEIVYNVGNLAQVKIFGKWIDIPRKQVAFGDAGLTYSFSGNTVPAKPWTPLLLEMRNDISKICGYDFNFVLVNRYQDGNDYMGEHKDDEKDLCSGHPIASLSLGQQRDFIFKHQDCRGKKAKRKIDKLTIQLENGCLLMMKAPTNSFWYHCLPKRPKVLGMRLNFTFRKMVPALCKPLKTLEGSI